MKTGVLLVNIGTPVSPSPEDVRKYLEEFLMDKFVVDIPKPARWFLVKKLIVPKRSHSSAALYQKVWRKDGSPLLVYSKGMRDRLQQTLGGQFDVQIGMRYGEPSISEQLKTWKGSVNRLLVVPLYPQYSEAATRSSVEKVQEGLKQLNWDTDPVFLDPFYERSEFIAPFIKRVNEAPRSDHVLFSFHGLPERQIRRNLGCLEKQDCCESGHGIKSCYRAQCFKTAHLIAEGAGLKASQYTVCFQSRLGRTPWISPYTDQVIAELPKQGKVSVTVVCPSFVVDCLETVEEVEIRTREAFVKAGGKALYLVPSHNDDNQWIKGLAALVDSMAHV